MAEAASALGAAISLAIAVEQKLEEVKDLHRDGAYLANIVGQLRFLLESSRAHFLAKGEATRQPLLDLLHALGCIDSLVEENLRRGPIYQFIYSGRILQRISIVSTQLVLHLNVLQAALGVQANHDVSRRFDQLCAQVAGLDASLKTLLAYRADSEALRRSVKADLQSGSAALPEPGRLLSIVEESVTRSLRRAQAGAGTRAEADVADRLLRNRGVAAPAQRPAARILAADDALQREIRAWLEDNAMSYEQADALILLQQRLRPDAAAPAPPQPAATLRPDPPPELAVPNTPGRGGAGAGGLGHGALPRAQSSRPVPCSPSTPLQLRTLQKLASWTSS